MLLLSVFICLLNEVNWHDATVHGDVVGEKRYLGKLRKTERLISRLG